MNLFNMECPRSLWGLGESASMMEKYRVFCEESTSSSFTSVVNQRPQLCAKPEPEAAEREFAIVAAVDLEGPTNLRLVNAFHFEPALRISRAMLGLEAEAPVRHLVDAAMGEITNMIAGPAKEQLDMDLWLLTPSVQRDALPYELIKQGNNTVMLEYELFGDFFLQILTEIPAAGRS